MTSELLRRVRVLDPVAQTDRVVDVLIVEGCIDAIADAITHFPGNTEIIDRPGLVLAPGLVDLYSYVGEPGFEARETLDSIARAATAGGFTRLTLLPTTDPPIDNPGSVEWRRSRLQAAPRSLHVNSWGALTAGVQGQQMAELAELASAGVAGFADGRPIANLALVQRLLEYCQPLNQPIAFWGYERELAGNGVVREGVESMRLGLPGNPPLSETIALAALLDCAETIGTPIHLMRVSTAKSVDLIRSAKARGVSVTASVTWMHLLLNVKAIHSYDPSLRLEPPLGNPADQAALIQAIEQGVIDAIAIDHSPYTYEEKTVAFAEAPAGAIGLELALPLLWQAFVASGKWDALTLWSRLSTDPAACLQQAPAQVIAGEPAELVLFDPQQTWQATPEALRSLSSNTPWIGKTVTGRVIRTWCP